MQLQDAIRTRISVRAYRPDPVPRDAVERLLETARWAPSGSNSQPWRVTVVSGEPLAAWRRDLLERLQAQPGEAARREVMDRRVRAGSLAALETLTGVAPYDLLTVGSHRLYDAPAALVVSFVAVEGAVRPDGLAAFVTTFMLAAHEAGIGTCWLGFVMGQPDLLRQYAQLPAEEQPAAVVCFGYPDANAAVNRFRSPRQPVEAFTRWVG